MNCNACHILINGYVDGEITDEEMYALKTHLHTCQACVVYLKRMEAVKTVMRRYVLLQNVPEVSPDFARTVSAKLQEIVAKEEVSLKTQLKQKYRHFVETLSETWIRSLRTRPATWITAVSCLCVFIAGIAFVNLFFVLEKQSPVHYPKVVTETIPPTATQSVALQETQSDQGTEDTLEPANLLVNQEMVSVQEEPIEYIEIGPESLIQIAESDEAAEKTAGSSALQEIFREQFADNIVHLEELTATAKSFIQLATVEKPSVEDYIYSHVIEVSQEQFVDDTLLVRYVNNAFTK